MPRFPCRRALVAAASWTFGRPRTTRTASCTESVHGPTGGGGGGSIIGRNVSLVNVGRSAACTAFVGVSSTTQCATTTVGVYADSAASAAGTRSWVLENAAGIDRVYISHQGRGGCPVRYLGAANDCKVTGTGLFAKDDPSAQTVWHLIRV